MTLILAGLLLLGSDEKKEVKTTCPVDGFSFRAVEIVETNWWGGRDADFCPHAFKTTPLEYFVWTCPSCGYTAKAKEFAAEVPEPVRGRLREGLKPREPIARDASQKEIPGHVKYDLLAQGATLRGRPAMEIGVAWLHAAWSCRQQGAVDLRHFEEWDRIRQRYGFARKPIELRGRNRTPFELDLARRVERDIGKKAVFGANRYLARYLAAHTFRKHGELAAAERWIKELEPFREENSVVADAADRMLASIPLEREFLRKALERYTEAAASKDLIPVQATEVTYLVGELHRRLDEPKAAAEWFDKALQRGPSDTLRKLIETQQSLLP